MTDSFKEIKGLNLPLLEKEILEAWETESTFQKSVSSRSSEKVFNFSPVII